eukprot:TRINITY_DN337_c0_g1_i1.p1 TRINITY_DN337_c0_g1~~TRINITY_DN337_c0_g1_i1.p1  ORF type:complete len:278 (+),score=52.22 TRINITY_DN337_c0_g1_i1:53-835(+)
MNEEEFLERYYVIETLSLQKYSEVLSVYDKNNKELKAVKILKNQLKEDIQRQVNFLFDLDHENILIPEEEFDLYDDEGSHTKGLVFKQCSCDLFDFCEEEQLEHKDTVEICRQMAEAVKYLHENNMAHCDIKLENFLVDKEDHDRIYLIDFEHSIKLDKKYTKKYKPGTSLYRPKETFGKKKKKKINPKKIDIFSLGITFHLLFKGCFPYLNDNDIKKGNLSLSKELDKNQTSLLKVMLRQNPKKRATIETVLNHPYFQK